ncbi:MAG TPA: diacylglycerol kinase family protein [Candidatus Acidoferrales bacterium]|nr:diacylglycerol kinase family protein [Candidatus Acidoferrales bacterium]
MRDVLEPSPATTDPGAARAKLQDAILIYNPTSGSGRERRQRELAQAAEILAAAGIRAELAATTRPGAATELARQAVRAGRELVIACGGDGTNNEIANGLAGSKVPMAVLPAGTANILAKELGIPWDIPAAARLIASGTRVRIALGAMSSRDAAQPRGDASERRYFLCVAGAGPDGAIVCGVDSARKLRIGILEYWLQGLRQFFSCRFPEFQIASAEKTTAATLVVAGRTKYYGGPFRITTGASLFEDSFEIVAFTKRSRFLLALCLPAIWLGCLRRMPGIETWKTRRISCEAMGAGAILAQVDGEAAGTLPMEFRIVPDALTLVIPSRTQVYLG